MSSSALRSLATTAEFVATLVPKLALSKAMTKNEAMLIAGQLRKGAEAALDIAIEIERGKAATDLDERRLRAATAAMLNSPAWPAVFRAGAAETLARAALSAAPLSPCQDSEAKS